ncbi:MAG: hypothetical protein IJ663_01835, partial [Spirochaetales bacterium]|nr:hypothetical protein [Spirochaetales bacterium]
MDDEQRSEEVIKEEEKRFSPIFFEIGGKMGKLEKGIHWVTSAIMVFICVVIIAGILVSFIRIPSYFENLFHQESGS